MSIKKKSEICWPFFTQTQHKIREPSLPYYLPITKEKKIGFIPLLRVLASPEMQTALYKIWTRVTLSISYVNSDVLVGMCKLVFAIGFYSYRSLQHSNLLYLK